MEAGTDAPGLAADHLVLTPMRAELPAGHGTVTAFESGAQGLALWLSAEVGRDAAERMHGERTWVKANVGGRLLTFAAVARHTSDGELEVNGISSPIVEFRRHHIRAATQVHVNVQVPTGDGVGRAGLEGYTVDLSSGGCRLELEPETAGDIPSEGVSADVTLDLPDDEVRATAQVRRVEREAGQVAVQFTELSPDDQARIDRHVLGLATG
ncbi:MAG: PilZ domain-containing protein [Actinomycetes bacterium]